MRYIFFGTPDFAAVILDKLIRVGLLPQAVVCNPDKPTGRKKIITAPPVKVLAQKYNLPVLQPSTLLKSQNPALDGALGNSGTVRKPRIGTLKNIIEGAVHLSSIGVDNSLSEPAEGFTPSESRVPILDPHYAAGSQDLLYQNWDFFIVAAYAKILPREILEIPRLGAIGVHPSLLPKYRGPSPIQTAILNGDRETGVTLFLMDERVDHGEILRNEKLEIRDEDNYESLSKKTAELGAKLLIKTLPKFISGEIKPTPQNENEATYTKKFSTENGFIESADLEKAEKEGGEIAKIIERKIRALNPEPGVWTIKDEKRMKILEAELVDGKLKITKLQVEGKKPRNI